MGWKPELTRAVVILLVLYALSLLDRSLIALLVQPIRADLGIDNVQIGLLQGFAFAVFYVVCGIPLGVLVDTLSRRLVIVGGVLCWSLATMACGLAHTFDQLLIARFAVGAGEAALVPAAYSLLGDVSSRKQLPMAMAVFSFGAIIGSGLSVVIGGGLVHHLSALGPIVLGGMRFAPWQLTFILVGALGLPLGLLAQFLPEPRSAGRAGRGTQVEQPGFAAFFRANWRFFVPHFLGYGMIYIASAGGSNWTPTYLQQAWGWDMRTIGNALGFGVIFSGLVGNFAAGWWVERRSARGDEASPLTYFAGGALCIAIAGAMSPWMGSGVGYLMLHLTTCVFTICGAAAGTALTFVTPPEYRGRVAALFTMVFNLLGTGLGPLSVGWMSRAVDGDEALAVALSVNYAVSGLAATILLLVAAREMRRSRLR